MHSPESTQELAHLRETSGPSPERTISSTPAIAACGSAPATPAAPVIGQASKHLPHLVQASSMASTRAVRAVSKALGMVPLRWSEPKGQRYCQGIVDGKSVVWPISARRRHRGSFRLDARKPDHLGPFLGFISNELA